MIDTAGQTGAFEGLIVNDIKGEFFIPSYQRGYRWGKDEVRRLLDDIKEADGSYYLQPVVVKRMSEDQWELIDGQQRLTTLFLILQHIKMQALPTAEVPYSLEYETRPRSAEYLASPTAEQADTNIDYYHIYEAWTCIQDWFAEQSNRVLEAINMYRALSERVKVIWYEAPETVNSTDLFTRLNVGKIPLTDAELVKALVLSKIQKIDYGSSSRVQAAAAEWDVIERDLRSPELWAFVTARSKTEATHIGFLLDTLAGNPSDGPRPAFYTFETLRTRIEEDAEQFWNSVADLHSLIVGWFEDRTLFHKIGYLVAIGYEFRQILDLAIGTRRSEFENKLDQAIQNGLRLSEEELLELSYENLQNHKKITDLLLLMNVETVRKLNNSSERYSFHAYASGSWSLEHIHAQNAQGLHTVEQWTHWLRDHRDAMQNLPEIEDEQRTKFERMIDEALPKITQDRFNELVRFLGPIFAPSGKTRAGSDLHSISNLALLDGNDNSALSNSMFEVKRLAVLKRDREGSFIPICTRNVFLKYYTRSHSQQLHFWGEQDREDYLAALKCEVGPYLMGSLDQVTTIGDEER